MTELQQFLVGSTFSIPLYQRDYSWRLPQVVDLLSDIKGAVADDTPHYLGTFVLSKTADAGSFDLVDGQQRLSTLFLIVDALLRQPIDSQERVAFTATLLRELPGKSLKLDFGVNCSFVEDMFHDSVAVDPDTGGRRRLVAAYHFALDYAADIHRTGGSDQIGRWIKTICQLQIIRFVTPDTGRAIRIFQTINDRGLSLSAMDKAKAMLVYYSNRYLNGVLDNDINERFGRCFFAFDQMREIVRDPRYRIANISRDGFGEDELLRYHYLSYAYLGDDVEIEGGLDFEGSTRFVLGAFLGQTLKKYADDTVRLRAFIDDYTADLSGFCADFARMVGDVRSDERLYKVLVVLGVSARLYPLLVRMYRRGLHRTSLLDGGGDLLACIETCDVRVYKTRGTNPGAHIGRLSHRSRGATADEIGTGLRSFTGEFMSDSLFEANLHNQVFHNGALPFVMLVYDEECREQEYSVGQLAELVTETITREHILPQKPDFDVVALGFADDQDYREHLHTLGNLTPLTASENARCSNKNVFAKVNEPGLYPSSRYVSTRQLAITQGSRVFGKNAVLKRTERLATWVLNKWRLRSRE